MARKKKFKLKNCVDHRQEIGVNQSAYWAYFGVTQSGGSRYENERNMPKPVRMLQVLLQKGVVTLDQLADAAAEADAAT